MNGKTKRVCQFPGCNTPLPRRHKVCLNCQTHKDYNPLTGGWTHQLAWGVFTPEYLRSIDPEWGRKTQK
jgi:hypothetical protein